MTVAELALPVSADLDARWVLGDAATYLDLSGRRVTLSSGGILRYDGLVIATGAHPGRPANAPPLPSFWSDLHGARIRSIGLPNLAHTDQVVEHNPQRHRLVVTYHRNGRLIGALTVNRTSRLAPYRTAIRAAAAPTKPPTSPSEA